MLDRPRGGINLFWYFLLLIFGVFCCATAVIFIKLADIQPITLSAFRLLAASIFLLPVFLRDYRLHKEQVTRKTLLAPVWPAVMLSIHFISWLTAARLTPAANASLIVNLVPLVMPVLLYIFLRERISGIEAVATMLALAGVGVLGVSDYNINPEFLYGDILCFISMIFYSIYLVLSRKNAELESFWLYIVPLYFTAFVFCFLTALLFEDPFRYYETKDLLLGLGLGLVPTVIGHTVMNFAMQRLRGQVVSIFTMFQFVFAGIMSYFIFNEIPSRTFYFVSLLLTLSGIMVACDMTKQASLFRGDNCKERSG